jgi:hypothetical protein
MDINLIATTSFLFFAFISSIIFFIRQYYSRKYLNLKYGKEFGFTLGPRNSSFENYLGTAAFFFAIYHSRDGMLGSDPELERLRRKANILSLFSLIALCLSILIPVILVNNF